MYSIYHIPGVKIGCSKRVEQRVKEQGYSKYELLEVHSDIDTASLREKELQKEYGYEIDCSNYIQVLQFAKAGNKLAIAAAAEKKRKPILAFSYETNKLIGEYKSVRAAGIALSTAHSNIVCMLKGRIKQINGYTFKYA